MLQSKNKDSYLIVVAHPDDEVLGAGATMYKLSQQDQEVNVCILSGRAEARKNRPKDDELFFELQESMGLLGVKKIITGEFPNIKFNEVPHLELVQFIEQAIIETDASIVFTHHPADINNDHLHTSLACQAATKLFQRNDDVRALKELFFMEIPSATDWGMNSSMKQFIPNTFIEVGEAAVEKKIEALSKYKGVMREYPHPRSAKSLLGLASYRGSQAGCNYAEAFESVFHRIV